MQLVTIKDYCAQKDVSRQFVYEYIRKGKFEVLELPIFVNFEGHVLEVGTQKFLKDPMTNQEKKAYWSTDTTDEEYDQGMANDSTENEAVRVIIKKMLSLKKEASADYKKSVFDMYPLGTPMRLEIDKALDKCADIMWLEMGDLDHKVTAFVKKVKAN
jgi:hypothetical protein